MLKSFVRNKSNKTTAIWAKIIYDECVIIRTERKWQKSAKKGKC